MAYKPQELRPERKKCLSLKNFMQQSAESIADVRLRPGPFVKSTGEQAG